MLEQRLNRLFSDHPDVLYGYADISYSPYKKDYSSALVIAVPYGEQLGIEDYTEERFEKAIQDAHKRLTVILKGVEEVLGETGIKYFIPPMAQENEEELLAPFSFKYAAVNAGLGWIGKNDVVITERYGPRVRLCAVLIDDELPYGEPILKSRCPDTCRKCVDICPYRALHDVTWDIDKLRGDIIDYKLCNQKRSLYIEKHGRKNACGLCMAVCPFGNER